MASVLDLVKHYQHTIEKYTNDEQKVLKCIEKLFQLGVTVQHLQETGVGRTVNALRKEPGDVGQAARSLVYKWKLMVAAEESDQEGDHNESTYNGHEKDSDDNAKQSKSKDNHHYAKSNSSPRIKPERHSSTNGDYSTKRKYQSSEEEDQDIKRSKQSSSSDNDDYKKKPLIKVKKEESESDSESDSEESQSANYDSETSMEDVKVKVEVKKEPSDKHRSSSSKHSSSHNNHVDHKKESHSNKSHGSTSDKPSHSSKSKDRHSTEKSTSKEKSFSSHRHKSSKEKESSKEKHKSEHTFSDREKKHKEENSSSKHISSDKSKSSSHKTDGSSDKHKNTSEKSSSKSEKHKSSRSHSSDKEKHKISSEKEISSHKSKSKENSISSSKDKYSSSSKDKTKDKCSSSKEKNSSHTEKLKHGSSADNRSSSHSKSQSERKSDDKKDKEKNEDSRELKSKHKSSSSSHKSSKSKEDGSSKSKEELPKKKVKSNSEDSEDGIDCGSGASFAEALGMISPTKPKKKSALKDTPSPNAFNDLSPASLLAPTAKLTPLPALEISALPEISPNYKPRPPPKLLNHLYDEDAMSAVISSKNQRTKVYSGNKVIGGKITSLYEMCVHVLQEHIDALEYTGGVPYEILKPVVDRATPQQLSVLEYFNPYLMEDTDHLWQGFCERQFRNKPRHEMETWREMYMRCQEEQEHRLKSLTANIRMTQEAKKAPIKQTKMAYVDSVVKPPRNVARKQAQHGTAHAAAGSPAARVASLSLAPNVLRAGRPPPAPPTLGSTSNKPKKAPLMQKALQFMRGRKR